MKIDRAQDPHPSSPAKKEDFRETLKKARPKKGLHPPVAPKGGPLHAEHPAQTGSLAEKPGGLHALALAADRALALKSVRSAQNAYADGLTEARSSGLASQQDHLSERAQALISRELDRDQKKQEAQNPAAPSPAGIAAQPPGLQPQPTQETPKVSRAEAARALVERIEVFLKTARPSLTLTLRGPFSGEAQIERVGPKTVAVRLKAKPGAQASLEVEALRQAMAERGLTLKTVSYG